MTPDVANPTWSLRLARRVAACSGGGVGVLGVAYALLWGQAKAARRVVKPPRTGPPASEGLYGQGTETPLRLAVLGDSGAAGIGAAAVEGTPGALLATGLAEAAGRPVLLDVFAVVGARSADLPGQVDRALLSPPDVAVIMIGANDVTHVVPPRVATVHLASAVAAMRAAGTEVVVGTCPDLGTIKPIAQPLRWVARLSSRRMAAAQQQVVDASGGRAVALGELLGPRFDVMHHLFSDDRFHPSTAGYQLLAAALLPCVRAAAGLPAVAEDMAEMVAAVERAKAVHAPLTQRAAADRAVARWWTRVRAGRSTEARRDPASTACS